ncbi:IclR family transcriptional regulator [Lysinibacter cavernae]|uniref:Glycerol operon regulatory protein n=1 Tax=Lysinibacter cavernae TaxID=1640652 RepID=A0A7X5TUU5_9MICO|nr:IclR family transcriptional regulator [Lysinibacter cavernae]NIH54803.1 DNA-binding IclR family transcriptional regulator [Lysinibacter cavernae]
MSQTVDRALQILDYLGEDERDLADVAALLDVHKSTALRLLQTLESHGYVRHDEQHRYRLGTQLFRLASAALGNLDIRAVAAPHLRRLSERTQQTIHLAAFDGQDVFYIDKYESQKTVRMYSRIGAPAPLYCTGVAKAILAQRSLSEQESLANGITYVRHTERTITTPGDFLADLAAVRKRGYALDDREHEDFLHCVAVPIKIGSQPVMHGISLSAPTILLSREQLLDLVPLLREAAAAISNDIS